MAWEIRSPAKDNPSSRAGVSLIFFLNKSNDQNTSGAKINAVAAPIEALTNMLEKRKGAKRYIKVPTKAGRRPKILSWYKYIKIPESMNPVRKVILTESITQSPNRRKISARSQGK